MSRYKFYTKDHKEVAYGYDRPLEEFFLQVFDEDMAWQSWKSEEENAKAEEIDPSGEGQILGWTTNPLSMGEVKRVKDIYSKLQELGCPHESNMKSLSTGHPF